MHFFENLTAKIEFDQRQNRIPVTSFGSFGFSASRWKTKACDGSFEKFSKYEECQLEPRWIQSSLYFRLKLEMNKVENHYKSNFYQLHHFGNFGVSKYQFMGKSMMV